MRDGLRSVTILRQLEVGLGLLFCALVAAGMGRVIRWMVP